MGGGRKRTLICLGSYNIRNRGNGGLDYAIRGMDQANLELGVLQDIKVKDGFYTRRSSGNIFFTIDVPSRQHVRVLVFYYTLPRFSKEALHQFGTNLISFHLESGGRQWYIVGCYLAPDKASTIEHIVMDIIQCSRVKKFW